MKLGIFSAFVLFALVAASPGEYVVLYDSDVDFSWSPPGATVGFVRIGPGLSPAGASARYGVPIGRFPALLDASTGLWVPASAGLDDALSSLLELTDLSSRLDEAQAQAAKPAAQKALENEYLDLVDAVYAKAGDPAPKIEDAKDLGKARAKVAKAREAKPGTGAAPGGGPKKQTADDVLEFVDYQQALLALDLQLREFDPNWRKNLKRHDP